MASWPGRYTCALLAGPPSPEKPGVPVPANVVIIPVLDTRRMREFALSLMYTFPKVSPAVPVGIFKRAEVAGPPSPENPGLLPPANREIVPAGETLRTTAAIREIA